MGFLVVGESVAGIAAALELAASGVSVCLISSVDNAGLEDLFLIGPTPLNAEPMRGTNYAELAVEHLRQAHVEGWYSGGWFGMWTGLAVDALTGDLVFDDGGSEEQYRFQGVVYAPGGREIGLPEDIEIPVRWRGLSYSAWSDAACFRGKPVAVIGCGHRAFEQALIAAEFAATILVLCEGVAAGDLGLLAPAVISASHLSVWNNAQVVELRPNEEGILTSLVTRANGQKVQLDASGVFVAHDAVVDWDLWGGRDAALDLQGCGKLVFAGIAAGVPYADHAALYASGIRAARECLAANANP
jgi:thioredoxin reductase